MAEYKLSILVEGIDRASGPLGNVSNALGTLGKIAAVGLAAFGAAVALTAKAALDAVADYERLGLALTNLAARELLASGQAQNMTAGLAQAAPRAQVLLKWIQRLAIESPFTQEGVAQSFRLAMAFGFTSEQAQRLTQDMIDFAAGSGASEDIMQRIALNLGQIATQGKLTGREVRDLAMAGLPVTNILAKAFGVSTGEITRMTSEGLIPANKAIEAIAQSLEHDFGGAAKRQTATWAGLMSTLSDIKTVGLRELFGGVFKAVQPYGANLVGYLSSEAFMAQLRKIGENMGVALTTGLTSLKTFFTNLSTMGGLDQLQQFFTTLTGGQGLTAAGVMRAIVVIISQGTVEVTALAEKSAALVNFAMVAIPEVFNYMKIYITESARLWAELFGGIQDGFTGLYNIATGKVISGIVKLATGLGKLGETAKIGLDFDAKVKFDTTKTETAATTLAATIGAIDTKRAWGLLTAEDALAQYDAAIAKHLAQQAKQEAWAASYKKFFGATKKDADDTKTSFDSLAGGADDATDAIKKTAVAAGSLADKARQASIGLASMLPGGATGIEGLVAPGAGGPFEQLYRLQDYAIRGAESPWAKDFTLGQQAAQDIIKNWQQGFYTADVTQFIDVNALAALIRRSGLAEASQQAFIDEIAALAGTNTAPLLTSLLGGTQDPKALALAAQTAVTPTATATVTALGKALDAQAPIIAAIGAETGATLTDSLTMAVNAAYGAGTNWITQLAAGITAGLPTLQAALQNVANLFPHSPAKTGPLHKAPDWRSYMLGGLNDAAAAVNAALRVGGGGGYGGYAPTPVYIGGDSYYTAVNDATAAALLLGQMAARRAERLNRFMG